MKYKNYIAIVFLGLLFLLSINAKKVSDPSSDSEAIDLKNIVFVENTTEIDLGFDPLKYLPEDFDPYGNVDNIGTINFIEDDEIELGFDTTKYLPKDFNPYKK